MRKRKLTIGIIGSAGVGKTTLAKNLSMALGVPFFEAKQITQPILERDGYDYGSGVQVERFLSSSGRQCEILAKTLGQQAVKGIGSFITDRTTVDLAAYAVAGLHDSDPSLLRRVLKKCKDGSRHYTHLFLCPWIDEPLDDNHKRTLNPWYQYQIHLLELGIMRDWGMAFTVLQGKSVEDRVEEVVRAIGGG